MPDEVTVFIMADAVGAQSFTSSVGVNAHIDSGAPGWEDTAVLQNEIAYLGVSHVRDGTPYDWALAEYVSLAKAGVTFDLTQENPVAAAFTTVGAAQDVARADTLQRAVPGSVQSMEGANEYNDNNYDLNGLYSYGNMAWGALDDQNLQAAVRADSTLRGVAVVAASAATVTSVPVAAPYVDASNWHVYGGIGEQLGANLAAGIAGAEASAPGKSVFVTETGISSSGYGSSFWGVTDEATQGIIDTNALLDSYKDGAARTFLYDLMDEAGGASQNNRFGLFRSDGTPKPAATDVRNLLSILADPGAGPNDAAHLGALQYAIAGLPVTASSMVLEKSDGTFDLVLWNSGATVSNGTADVAPQGAAITVTFADTYQRIDAYDPMSGANPVASAFMSNTMSLSLGVDPLVVQVRPAANTLVLALSEDAYLGDAQFTVSVDGTQIGGAQTVTAPHGQGRTQSVVVPGSFSSGPHSVAVSFLNDAWGGSAAKDRNLYVDGITLGGDTVTLGAELYGNGTQTYGVGTAGTGPVTIGTGLGSITLEISEDAWRGDAQFVVTVDGLQIGGVQTAGASHASGLEQAFTFYGNFSAGRHTVAVTFLNDLYGGSTTTDRNLYVNNATVNGGTTSVGAALYANGTKTFVVGAPSNVTQATTIGAGADSLVLAISEDAWLGDAQFTVSVDGTEIGGPQTVTAAHAAGLDQAFTVAGNFGLGVHDVAITFLNPNDVTPPRERALYIDRIGYGAVTTDIHAMLLGGTDHFAVSTSGAATGGRV